MAEYTVEDAKAILAGVDVEHNETAPEWVMGVARLAIREHERAEAMAQRVAEMEARAVRAEAAVGVLAGLLGDIALCGAAAAAEWAWLLLNGHCVHCDDGHHLGGHDTPAGQCRHCGRLGPAISTPTSPTAGEE